jgi:hypothetical protein
VDTGISYSTGFGEWESAIAAGATLDELYKWESNKYPLWFKAKVVAWHNMHVMVELHSSDAVNKKQEAESKRHK